jgi:uncharacterized protein
VRDPFEGVSPRGTIVTGVRRDRVPAAFEPVLGAASELVQAHGALGSLYLYGSVATGQAQEASSDVDLFTIDVRPEVTASIAHTLSRQFSHVCRAVDIGTATTNDYRGYSDVAYGNRVFLRHYSVHISGPPHHQSLPDYPADARAARGLNGDIALHADRWRIALHAREDQVELARRVARKSLLAVAGLVSIHDRTWTTDRASSASRWAGLHPERANDLSDLVSWMDGQVVPTRTALARMLDGFTVQLVRDFKATIGLWR